MRAMLEQHAYEFDTRISRGLMLWVSAFLVLRTHIRAMLEERAHDLDVNVPVSRRHEQRGRAIFGPRICVCTVLEKRAYEFDTPITRGLM